MNILLRVLKTGTAVFILLTVLFTFAVYGQPLSKKIDRKTRHLKSPVITHQRAMAQDISKSLWAMGATDKKVANAWPQPSESASANLPSVTSLQSPVKPHSKEEDEDEEQRS